MFIVGEHAQRSFDSLAATTRAPGGGFTLHLGTRNMASAGFVVSTYPDRTSRIRAASFNPRDIRRFIAGNQTCLDLPGRHLGAWHNEETGLVELDITIVAPDQARAVLLGVTYGQKAVYDLSAQQEIRLEHMRLNDHFPDLVA